MQNAQSPIEYRPVSGFTGYRIGSDGTLWSERVTGPSNGGERTTGTWRLLKTKLEKHQAKSTHTPIYRLRACLSRDGKEYHRFVHILVCEAFHGPRPAGMFATHNDGNSMNNRADNLSWKTPQGNTQDAIKHGTLRRGEGHGQSRFTTEQILAVRRRHADGESKTSLAREYGVDWRAIDFIVKRQHWTHLPDFQSGHRAFLESKGVLHLIAAPKEAAA